MKRGVSCPYYGTYSCDFRGATRNVQDFVETPIPVAPHDPQDACIVGTGVCDRKLSRQGTAKLVLHPRSTCDMFPRLDTFATSQHQRGGLVPIDGENDVFFTVNAGLRPGNDSAGKVAGGFAGPPIVA